MHQASLQCPVLVEAAHNIASLAISFPKLEGKALFLPFHPYPNPLESTSQGFVFTEEKSEMLRWLLDITAGSESYPSAGCMGCVFEGPLPTGVADRVSL